MHLGTPLNSKSDPDNDLFHAQQAIHLLLPIVDPDLRHWHTRVSMYVQSAAFKEHLQQVANSPYKQGILINAGGRKLMTHAIIFRHTLTVQLRYVCVPGDKLLKIQHADYSAFLFLLMIIETAEATINTYIIHA